MHKLLQDVDLVDREERGFSRYFASTSIKNDRRVYIYK